MTKPYIVGICGGSGSGKTTFITRLLQNFEQEQICLISLDNYYKPIDQQEIDANGKQNYDTPQAIDIENFEQDLQQIINGQTVRKLEYDFNNPNYVRKMLELRPSRVIIIEGVFVFNYTQLANLFDLKIFIDTDEHLRIARRIKRDLSERGYPVEDTLYYIENHVVPGFTKYVLPYRNICDLIVPNHQDFENSLEVVSSFLKTKW